ncbi:unknown [Bacteroides sp. CAG:770]|nr:unknown [Bacteroides sp. CAG:770]
MLQYVTPETLTVWDMWKQNAPMIFRRFLKNIYAKWIQFITFTAGLGSL